VSARPPSWRPTAWQERFIRSLEPRISLTGPEHCGKQRCLIEAAAVGHLDPIWRAVIICIGADAKAAMVRATTPVYSRMSAEYAAAFGSEWRFRASGAIVRIAEGIHEARAGTGYDMVCLDHLEEFRDSEVIEARRLLRKAPGRHPRLRATRRVERNVDRHFPARIMFDDDDAGDVADEEVAPELTDLERLVRALTLHFLAAGGAGTWDAVRDALRAMAPGPHDAETIELVKAVEARDGDDRRLAHALDRARHHLAEMQGAEAGACHVTCSPACSLRVAPRDMSADVPLR
jgi:hypothetical protein